MFVEYKHIQYLHAHLVNEVQSFHVTPPCELLSFNTVNANPLLAVLFSCPECILISSTPGRRICLKIPVSTSHFMPDCHKLKLALITSCHVFSGGEKSNS